MNKADALRQMIADNQLIVGGHVFSSDAQFSELMGYHGYDFVWIDAEHSALDLHAVLSHISACASGGAASFVRVAWNDPVRIKQVLEMGPDGIIMPFICSGEEARRAVEACMYPPLGSRGFGPRRAMQYGAISKDQYLAQYNRTLLKIMQVEHKTAVENLRDILAVPGVDMIVIGPNDLSASYGHLDDPRHPELRPVYEGIVSACREAGIPCGVSIGAGCKATIDEWIARDIQFIGCGDDLGFAAQGVANTLHDICRRGTDD